jgi:hypothetical protein
MEGRWYTTGGGGGTDPLGVLLFAVVIIAGGGVAAGIAQAVASLVTVLLITAAIVIGIVIAALAGLVVHRVRHPDTRMIPKPRYHQLNTGTEAKAIVPRQPPMIVNNYFGGNHTHHGSGPDTAAAIRTPLIQGAITGDDGYPAAE